MKDRLLFLVLILIYMLTLFHFLGCKSTPYNPDTDPDVLDWYIEDNDTIIYKKQDSIRDARERWEYHRSLAHDSLWE